MSDKENDIIGQINQQFIGCTFQNADDHSGEVDGYVDIIFNNPKSTAPVPTYQKIRFHGISLKQITIE